MAADGRSNARSSPAPASGTSRPCACGCKQPAKPGGRFASGACRARAHDREHPRVDLSGVPEGERERVLGKLQAIAAPRPPARPDRHRPRRRVYLDEAHWPLLEELSALAKLPMSAVVRSLVERAYDNARQTGAI